MLPAESIELLESACSLIVGTVGPDGSPHATRAWGVDLPTGPGEPLRLVVDADDHVAVEHLAAGGAVAVTAADVPTLRSLQLKGRAVEVEPATEEHRARAARHCDDFFGVITETDGTDRALLDRMVPSRFAACLVVVDAVYDQTPGPGAGSAVPASSA